MDSDLLVIQKAGANARALGLYVGANPYLASKETPGATGEQIETWHAKVSAWDIGWRAEDLMSA